MTSLNKDSTFDREELSEMMVATSGKEQTGKEDTIKSTSFGMNDRDNTKQMLVNAAQKDSDLSPEKSINLESN